MLKAPKIHAPSLEKLPTLGYPIIYAAQIYGRIQHLTSGVLAS